MSEDIPQSVVETANDLFISMYRTIEAMFSVPLNLTVFDLAHRWENIPAGARQRKAMQISSAHFTTVIAVEGLEPTQGTNFEYDEEISIDEDWLDQFYRHDRIYTYSDLVTTFFAAAQQLFFLREAVFEQDAKTGEYLNHLLSLIADSNLYRNLRHAEPHNPVWITTMFSQLAPIAALIDALTDADDDETSETAA